MNINDKENLVIKINMLEQENAQLRAEVESYRGSCGMHTINEIKELKAEVEELKGLTLHRHCHACGAEASSDVGVAMYKENEKLRELMKDAIKMIDRYPSEKDCACVRCIWLEKAKEVLG